MPDYSYRARDASGKMVKGTVRANSEAQLDNSLRQQGLFLISATLLQDKAMARTLPALGGRRGTRRTSAKDLLNFTVNIQALYAAGVPLLQGLNDIMEQTEQPGFRDVLGRVLEQIKEGANLSDAFEQHPKTFPKLFVSLVRSGERAGTLDKIFSDLIRYLEWQQEIRAQVKQATIYPSIILLAVVGLITLLIGYVFPKFFKIFQDFAVELPLPTKILLAVSNVFQHHYLLLIAGTAMIVGGSVALYRTEKGRWFIDGLKFKFPIFGKLLHKIALSRFSHNLSILMKSGVDIQLAMGLLEGVVENMVMSESIRQAKEDIRGGSSISEALQKRGAFPPLIIRMISIGEKSGQLDLMMEKIATYYDREVPATLKKIFTIMEPLILMVLGAIVGFVALSIFLPIYKIQSSIR